MATKIKQRVPNREEAMVAVAAALTADDPECPCTVEDLKHDGRGLYEPAYRVESGRGLLVLNCAVWAARYERSVVVVEEVDEAEGW